jgi:hypothetical protein
LWRLKLDLLKTEEQWDELFEICSDLLRRARVKDKLGQLVESGFSDWIVWDSYISAALNMSPKTK